MGRKSKISYEDKIKACEDYLNGKASAKEIAEHLRLGPNGNETVRKWSNKYRQSGPESLLPKLKNSSYTKEFKINAVEEYLSGNGTLEEICNQYQIPSHSTLRKWIAKYNDLKELEDYKPRPEVYTKMAYRKKTTQEEREEIVNYCIEHNKDYKGTAAIYDVSYSQVYGWVQKYLEKGTDGLTDKRGKRKDESELTEVEKLRRQNKILEARVRELEMESVLLKKVEEIERRRSFQKRKMK
ncbi:MAG: transposase [Solobacterium sp.]|nr:transposase [Solobacterium sp.]MBR3241599.1 transposase [Parasporobacterium sp.]MBR3357512.1 transposase [Solobacterium sp.]